MANAAATAAWPAGPQMPLAASQQVLPTAAAVRPTSGASLISAAGGAAPLPPHAPAPQVMCSPTGIGNCRSMAIRSHLLVPTLNESPAGSLCVASPPCAAGAVMNAGNSCAGGSVNLEACTGGVSCATAARRGDARSSSPSDFSCPSRAGTRTPVETGAYSPTPAASSRQFLASERELANALSAVYNFIDSACDHSPEGSRAAVLTAAVPHSSPHLVSHTAGATWAPTHSSGCLVSTVSGRGGNSLFHSGSVKHLSHSPPPTRKSQPLRVARPALAAPAVLRAVALPATPTVATSSSVCGGSVSLPPQAAGPSASPGTAAIPTAVPPSPHGWQTRVHIRASSPPRVVSHARASPSRVPPRSSLMAEVPAASTNARSPVRAVSRQGDTFPWLLRSASVGRLPATASIGTPVGSTALAPSPPPAPVPTTLVPVVQTSVTPAAPAPTPAAPADKVGDTVVPSLAPPGLTALSVPWAFASEKQDDALDRTYGSSKRATPVVPQLQLPVKDSISRTVRRQLTDASLAAVAVPHNGMAVSVAAARVGAEALAAGQPPEKVEQYLEHARESIWNAKKALAALGPSGSEDLTTQVGSNSALCSGSEMAPDAESNSCAVSAEDELVSLRAENAKLKRLLAERCYDGAVPREAEVVPREASTIDDTDLPSARLSESASDGKPPMPLPSRPLSSSPGRAPPQVQFRGFLETRAADVQTSPYGQRRRNSSERQRVRPRPPPSPPPLSAPPVVPTFSNAPPVAACRPPAPPLQLPPPVPSAPSVTSRDLQTPPRSTAAVSVATAASTAVVVAAATGCASPRTVPPLPTTATPEPAAEDELEKSTEPTESQIHLSLSRAEMAGSRPFGVKTDRSDGRTLLITAIQPRGMIDEWNDAREPHERIKAGDRIISVNGARGCASLLLEECRKALHLTMVIQRPCEAVTRPRRSSSAEAFFSARGGSSPRARSASTGTCKAVPGACRSVTGPEHVVLAEPEADVSAPVASPSGEAFASSRLHVVETTASGVDAPWPFPMAATSRGSSPVRSRADSLPRSVSDKGQSPGTHRNAGRLSAREATDAAGGRHVRKASLSSLSWGPSRLREEDDGRPVVERVYLEGSGRHCGRANP